MVRKRFSVSLIWVIVLLLLTVYAPSLYAASPTHDTLESEAAYLPGSRITVDRTLLTFGGLMSGGNVGPETVIISSTGTDPLAITNITLTGPNAGNFILTPPATPVTLNPLQSTLVDVTFNPAVLEGNNYAILNIFHDDPSVASPLTVEVRGLSWTGGLVPNAEPSLQEILNVYNIPTDVGDNDPATTTIHSAAPLTIPLGQEVLVPVFQRVNAAQPVTVEVLGVFAINGFPSPVLVGFYTPGNRTAQTQVFSINANSHQTLSPATSGPLSFNPTGAFGMYTTYPPAPWNGRNVFTEDAVNVLEDAADGGGAGHPWTDPMPHHARVYQYRLPNGTIEPNAYIIAYEEAQFGFDYNDIVFVIRNVEPGALAPGGEIEFQNRDWIHSYTAAIPQLSYLNTWLTFNRVQNFTLAQYHDVVTLRIRNVHPTDTLTISSLSIDDPTDFTLPNGEDTAVPFTIPPNGFYDLDVQFIRNVGPRAVYHSTLHIGSSDSDEGLSDIHLAGIWQQANLGGWEPFLSHVIEALGFTTNIGPGWEADGTAPPSINADDVDIPGSDEVSSPTGIWQRLDPVGDLYVRAIGAWHNPGAGGVGLVEVTGGGPDPGAGHNNLNYQTILPLNNGGTATENAWNIGTVPATTFLFRMGGSQTDDPEQCRLRGYSPPTVPTVPPANDCEDIRYGRRGIRLFQLRNNVGELIPGAYIIAQDVTEITQPNYDYQDNIGIVFNVAPVITDIDPTVTGSVAPDPVVVNNQATFTFRVRNATTIPVTGLVLTGTYPGGVTIDGVSATQGTCSFGGGTYTCNIGNLSTSQEVVVTLLMTSATEGVRTVTANVTDTDPRPDINPGNNSANVSVTFFDPSNPSSTITIIKDAISDSPQVFTFGGSFGSFNLVDDGSTVTPLYRYNFQPAASAVPSGFTADIGLPYSVATGFGWWDDIGGVAVNNTANARQNPVPAPPDNWIPQENLTYNHMQRALTQYSWIRDLPNGFYDVTVSVGDTVFTNSNPHLINIEGQNVITFFPVGGPPTRIFTTVARVYVGDGQMNVDAIGGDNTKIDYIIIRPLPSNEASFAVTPGTYTVTEDTAGLPANWSLSGVSCTGGSTTNVPNGVQITVGSNQDVVCTFTNVDATAPLVAVDDFATTPINTPVIIDVVANDTGIVPGTVAVQTFPAGGLVNNGDGTFTYTPPSPVFQGTDTFTYNGQDATGTMTSNTATVTITVGGNPTANDDGVVILTSDAIPYTIDVLANDTDPQGNGTIDPSTTQVGTPPAAGNLVNNLDGTFDYTPAGPGTYTFTYTVEDVDGNVSNEATVTIIVNDVPVAVDDNGTGNAGATTVINAIANDTDTIGGIDPTSIVITSGPTNGTATPNPDGTIDYDPDPTFTGPTDSFTYTVTDIYGETSNVATVTITFNNIPPVANDDSANADSGVAIIIDLTGNDTDADGTIDVTSLAAGGTAPAPGNNVVFNADGTATYTADIAFSGVDTFTYTVLDNTGAISNEATVTVTVNASPVAVDDSDTTLEDTPITIDLTTNDTDSDGTIDITSLAAGGTAPTPGNTVVFNADGTATYTPTGGFSGVDTFTYTVLDNDGAISNEATVTITVFGTAPGITVSITPATQQVLSGANTTFDVTVTNTSSAVALDNVSVFNNNTLPFVSDCARGLGTLAASAVVTFTCTDTAITADYDKTITVSGEPQNGAPTVTDDDTVSVTIYVPEITIVINPPTQDVPLDGTAVFFITVTNTGPSALQNAVVTDSDPTSDCEVDQATQPGLALMNPGAVVNYTCTVTNVLADFTNTVTVNAEDVASGAPVTDNASADVVMLPPDIELTITPAVQAVIPGNAAVFTITVTNTGPFDLDNVTITDSDATSDCEADGTRFPQLLTLAAGASFNYPCMIPNVVAPLTNTADVTATPVGGGAPVTDSDSADVTLAVGNPSITITVTADAPVVPYGGNADFTIVVVNNGDTQLNNVTITALNATGCSINVGTLAAGAGQTYSCSEPGVTTGFTNTADVVGTIAGGGGATVTASDSDSVQVAGLTITKDPVVQTVASGGTANYSITVENIGEVELDVTVTDPTVAACDNAIGLLAAGASTTYACSQPGVVANFTNTASASGITTDGSNVTVTDDDSADVVVTVTAPSISVVMSPATQTILTGTTANFTVTVTNNGNEQIDGVVVSNDVVAACDADQTTQVGLASIAVGASVSYTCSEPNVTANFTNTVTANGTSTPGGTPVTDTDTADVTVTGSLFDPPFGFKAVTDEGNSVLRWGFFWTNNGPTAVQMRVTDTVPAGLTLIPGSVTCTTNPGGALTTTFCGVVGNEIVWEGILQPEPVPGVTRLVDAVNPLIVSFRTQVPDGINSATNISNAEYDSDGDGALDATANSNQATWSRGVPTVDDPTTVASASVSNGTATIVKTASPPFAGTGENVTFTITISNNSDQPIAAIGLTDDVPAEFEILSASASFGSPTVSGQTVSLAPFFLGQGQSVTLTIETRIRDSVQAPFVLFNIACTTDVADTLCANTRVLSVSVLPQTGQSPWSVWRPIIFLLAGLFTAFAAGWVIRRVRQPQDER